MYVPPHLRDKDRQEPSRSLDDLASCRLQARLRVPVGFQLDCNDCPVDIEAHDSVDTAYLTEYLITLPVGLPPQDQLELMAWFSRQCSNPGARSVDREGLQMELPKTLSKQERAAWHRAAQELGLSSQSKGIGSARFLAISTANSGNAAGSSCHVDRGARQQARDIFTWCQDAGGAFWAYSLGEILQAVQTGSLPADVIQLCAQRQAASRLHDAILACDHATAAEMIEAEPELAYIRHHGGDFAVHLACQQGLETIVAKLVLQPGIVEQRGIHRRLPLDLVYSLPSQEQGRLPGILLSAGASALHVPSPPGMQG